MKLRGGKSTLDDGGILLMKCNLEGGNKTICTHQLFQYLVNKPSKQYVTRVMDENYTQTVNITQQITHLEFEDLLLSFNLFSTDPPLSSVATPAAVEDGSTSSVREEEGVPAASPEGVTFSSLWEWADGVTDPVLSAKGAWPSREELGASVKGGVVDEVSMESASVRGRSESSGSLKAALSTITLGYERVCVSECVSE